MTSISPADSFAAPVTPAVTSDWWFIGVDETEHWVLPKNLRPYVRAIHTVFVFNRNEHTYCCEMQPSYWMHCVDYSPTFTEEAYDLPHFNLIRDALFQLIGGVPRNESDRYMHVSTVEQLLSQSETKVPRVPYGQVPDEEELDTPEIISELYEAWSRNPYF